MKPPSAAPMVPTTASSTGSPEIILIAKLIRGPMKGTALDAPLATACLAPRIPIPLATDGLVNGLPNLSTNPTGFRGSKPKLFLLPEVIGFPVCPPAIPGPLFLKDCSNALSELTPLAIDFLYSERADPLGVTAVTDLPLTSPPPPLPPRLGLKAPASPAKIVP